MAKSAAPAQPTPQDIMAANMAARAAVVSNSIKMTQLISSTAVSPATQPTLNIPPRNVGLILGFIVEVSGVINNGSAVQLDRTNFGTANMVSSFQYQDLSNYTRIQVPGWYMALLDTARNRMGYGGVYANNIPMGYGNNFTVYQGPATIAAMTASTPVRMQYFVPLAYSSTDLRGSIYANVVNATQNLQINLNQTPVVANGADQLNAVYIGDAAGSVAAATWSGNVTVKVWQVYLDQLPRYNGGPLNGQPILPLQDLNTVYDLKQTTFTAVTAAQDYPLPYSNYRSFLSTCAVFDNNGTFNSGSDINYWALQAANFTNIFNIPPEIVALKAREIFMADPPPGTYWFESRDIPINTINFGNMNLVINASTATAGNQVLVGYEAFGLVNQLVGASGLNI